MLKSEPGNFGGELMFLFFLFGDFNLRRLEGSMCGFPVENGWICQKDPESPLPHFTFSTGVVVFCMNVDILWL